MPKLHTGEAGVKVKEEEHGDFLNFISQTQNNEFETRNQKAYSSTLGIRCTPSSGQATEEPRRKLLFPRLKQTE